MTEEEASMSAKLVVSAGPDEGKSFSLTDGASVTIGRGDMASSRLTDPPSRAPTASLTSSCSATTPIVATALVD